MDFLTYIMISKAIKQMLLIFVYIALIKYI